MPQFVKRFFKDMPLRWKVVYYFLAVYMCFFAYWTHWVVTGTPLHR